MKETIIDRLKEMIFKHHTENDLLQVRIIRGKDHVHLECTEGQKTIYDEKLDSLDDSIEIGTKFLNTFKGDKQ